jgi:thiol-disulfide isomerase/thioredoxin
MTSAPLRFAPFCTALALALALAGCNESAKSAPPAVSRFESVSAKAPAADPLAELCDVKFEAGQGPVLTLPALDAAPPEVGGSQWLNLWATWCKPCVEEMPMIEKFRTELAGKGTALRVHFVSVDATSELVATFRTQHPGLPATSRVADPSAVAPYIQALGLDAGAGLPVHAFTGSDGKVRCVRSGAVVETDLEAIASLVK